MYDEVVDTEYRDGVDGRSGTLFSSGFGAIGGGNVDDNCGLFLELFVIDVDVCDDELKFICIIKRNRTLIWN